MKKVLVTGGAGYCSVLVPDLLKIIIKLEF